MRTRRYAGGAPARLNPWELSAADRRRFNARALDAGAVIRARISGRSFYRYCVASVARDYVLAHIERAEGSPAHPNDFLWTAKEPR
jgi:hypothetical protein